MGSPGTLCSFWSGKHLQRAEMPQSCPLLSSAMYLTFPYQFLHNVDSMRALTKKDKCQHTWLQSRHLSWMFLLRDCPSLICCIVNEWHFCRFNLCFMLLLISLSHKEFILCSWAHLQRAQFPFSATKRAHTAYRHKKHLWFLLGWFQEMKQLKGAECLSGLHSCWAGTGRAQIHMCLPGHHCAHTKTPLEIEDLLKGNSRVFSVSKVGINTCNCVQCLISLGQHCSYHRGIILRVILLPATHHTSHKKWSRILSWFALAALQITLYQQCLVQSEDTFKALVKKDCFPHFCRSENKTAFSENECKDFWKARILKALLTLDIRFRQNCEIPNK